LVVTGLDPGCAHHAINALVVRIRRGEVFDVGSPDTSVDGLAVRLGAVHHTQWTQGRFAMWVNYYGMAGMAGDPLPDPAAVQVLWANDDGVFPPDRDFCREHRDCQPILSVAVAHDVNRPIGRGRGKAKRNRKRR
jgi:hypothetical protein